MKKSFVTAVVTTMFIVYSLYQRMFGVEPAAGVAASPGLNNLSFNSSQTSPSSNSLSVPNSTSSSSTSTSNSAQSDQSQADPSQAQAGNAATPAPQNTPTPAPQNTPAPAQSSGSQYKDGTYNGDSADAFYGNIQVQAKIANGKLTDIQFLQWPNDRSRSVMINRQALPWLVQEAIQAQSENVDLISGATDSSYAFAESLQTALAKAKR